MARQSRPQRETIRRVMHEFEHGEMKAKGRPVKRRRRAIALVRGRRLEPPEPGREAPQPRPYRQRERQGAAGRRAGDHRTRAGLYEEARRRDIPGRSRMSKAELARALRR